tara:strand:+ start:1072 stop:3138 length:2067 start_codon:yes stop_codon:yes gene_type:complete
VNITARVCFSLFLTAANSLAVSPWAYAAETEEQISEVTVYTLEDFRQYSPRTALDMVTRIPGFAIQGDNSNQRGFGQAQGNVLINGQRVSGKSNGAVESLGRIVAQNVVRIELVDGSQFDIPGLSGQVVNVVTNGLGKTAGTWSWSSRFRDNLPPYYNDFNIALSGGKGALGWMFELDSSPERGANNGPEYITDGQGDLLEKRLEDFTHAAEYASVAGSLSWKPASGAVGNLNASYAIYEPDNKEVSKTYPVGGPEGRRLFKGSEDEWAAELGADYELGVGPGRLKTIGLVRREYSPITDEFLRGDVDGSDLSRSLFQQTIDEGEYILRSEYAFGHVAGRDWQIAAEGAFNYLEATSSLREADDGGPLLIVDLTNANSRVEEQRGEISVTHGRQLSPRLSAQVSLGMEVSELSQSGDVSKVRTFTRPKGYASLTWQADDSLKLITRLERDVGQLDFFDFISSVNLNSDNGQTGNSEIVPEQSWTLSLKTEKDFGAWGAATLKVFGASIEDIVDRIPIDDGDGPGNLDTAWQVGAELEATLKLARAGVPGAEITLSGEWYDSEVTDPLTGETRPINGDTAYYLFSELRHDIPKTNWAWGIGFEGSKNNSFYRLSEVSLEAHPPGFGYVYIEDKDIFGATGRITIGNITNQNDNFWREIHDGSRLDDVLVRETRERDFGQIFTLRLEGTF